MALTKAFAIEAEPAVIWQALWADLQGGDGASFEVVESSSPHSLAIRLELGGMPVTLAYRIEEAQGGSEVSVTLTPHSRRYAFYQLLTFGHLGRNFAMPMVEGLSNLKQAVEDGPMASVQPAE